MQLKTFLFRDAMENQFFLLCICGFHIKIGIGKTVYGTWGFLQKHEIGIYYIAKK